MKQRLYKGAAVAVTGMLALAACGGGSGGGGTTGGGNTGSNASKTGFASCDTSPNDCNSGTAKQGGSFIYTIEKNISDWNILSADGNTFETAEVLDGVIPSVFIAQPDLSVKLNTDLMVSAEQTSTSPQTLVYKISPKAVWSDGTQITGDDFKYAWQTQDGKHCKDCAVASTSGYDQISKLETSSDGKTVTVTMTKPFTDWQSMFTLVPAHIAKAAISGDLYTPANLAKSFATFKSLPKWSGGPFTIQSFKDNQSVTEVKNPKWYGSGPNLSTLVFRVITDANQEPPALQNNEVQGIYPQPQVDLVSTVKNIPSVIYRIGAGLTWEHFDLNLKNPALKDVALRQAMFTAVDRQGLISKTVGQFAPNIKPLQSHNFMPSQKGYTDVLPSDQGSGNTDAAKKMLTDAGYTGVGTALKDKSGKAVPTFKIRYTTGNAIRAQECQLFKADMAKLGININIVPTDDLGGTLSKNDYDVIVFAWVGTPFVYAGAEQLWTTSAITNGGNYGGYSNSQVDTLLTQAAQETDQSKATQDVNDADKIMSKDAYVLPLYQKPTFLAVYKNMVNIRDNATAVGPPYNDQDWGISASAS